MVYECDGPYIDYKICTLLLIIITHSLDFGLEMAVSYSRDPEGCDNGLKLSTPKGKEHYNFTYDDAPPPYPSRSWGGSPPSAL